MVAPGLRKSGERARGLCGLWPRTRKKGREKGWPWNAKLLAARAARPQAAGCTQVQQGGGEGKVRQQGTVRVAAAAKGRSKGEGWDEGQNARRKMGARWRADSAQSSS